MDPWKIYQINCLLNLKERTVKNIRFQEGRTVHLTVLQTSQQEQDPYLTPLPNDIAALHSNFFSDHRHQHIDDSSNPTYNLKEDINFIAAFGISTITSVTWDMGHGQDCYYHNDMQHLLSTIESGFLTKVYDLPPTLRQISTISQRPINHR